MTSTVKLLRWGHIQINFILQGFSTWPRLWFSCFFSVILHSSDALIIFTREERYKLQTCHEWHVCHDNRQAYSNVDEILYLMWITESANRSITEISASSSSSAVRACLLCTASHLSSLSELISETHQWVGDTVKWCSGKCAPLLQVGGFFVFF